MRLWYLILLFFTNTAFALTKQETHCIAYAVFKEANIEHPAGRAVVRDIILHRAKKQSKTVCQIIKQQGQFTFKGNKNNLVATKYMLTRYTELDKVKSGLTEDYVYFFNKRLHPSWARKLSCKIVGNHKVCKESK